jgi:hypothetical protein
MSPANFTRTKRNSCQKSTPSRRSGGVEGTSSRDYGKRSLRARHNPSKVVSDEFEKLTTGERKLERLRRLIVKVEEKTKPKSRYTKRGIQGGVYYNVVPAT